MDLISLSIGDMEPQVDNLGFSIMDLNKFTFMGGDLAESETGLLGAIRQQLFQAQNILESSIRKALADPSISSVEKQKLESYLTNIKSAREWQPQQASSKAQIDLSAWSNDKNSLNSSERKSLSEQGIQALKGMEGFSARSYSDYSQHTNGYGTKARYAGEAIDPQTAELRLKDDLKHREAFINRVAEARLEKTGKGLSQAQFDSLTMMVFNLGLGQAHEVHQAVIDGKDELVPKLMNKYVHAGGKALPGLISRRQQEAGLYNYGAEQLSEAEAAIS
jgi:GH24 family phage-related lysozyme (muramidase)